MSYAKGVDVSHHQGDVDWAKVGNAVDFAFIKATEGTSYVDEKFERNRAAAHKAGLIVGLYHFGHPDNDPHEEADHFLRTVGDLHPHELPLVLDIETHDTRTPAATQNWCHAFLARLEEVTERKPIVYSYPAFIESQLGSALTLYPLWIASYRAEPSFTRWSKWLFWQTSSDGAVPGIAGRCDVDVFNGTVEELKERVGLAKPAPKPAPNPAPKPKPEPEHHTSAITSWYHRVLHEGLEGRDVRIVQRKVGATPDGHFGPVTEQRVRSFQKAHGLHEDGHVGPRTAERIGEAATHGQVPEWYHRSLHVGEHGEDVKAVQEICHVARDGIFGKDTEQAVRRFQSAHGLNVTGRVTRKDAIKMGDI